MYKVIKDILEVFQSKHLKVFFKEDEADNYVYLYFELSNGGPYQIRFISTDDKNDVAVRVFRLIRVEPAQREKVILLLNDLNNQYRYAKFCCDSKCCINVEYDYPLCGNDPAQSAEEILFRFVSIIDEAYSSIMKCVWDSDANLK